MAFFFYFLVFENKFHKNVFFMKKQTEIVKSKAKDCW